MLPEKVLDQMHKNLEHSVDRWFDYSELLDPDIKVTAVS